jgi:archaemetzincin
MSPDAGSITVADKDCVLESRPRNKPSITISKYLPKLLRTNDIHSPGKSKAKLIFFYCISILTMYNHGDIAGSPAAGGKRHVSPDILQRNKMKNKKTALIGIFLISLAGTISVISLYCINKVSSSDRLNPVADEKTKQKIESMPDVPSKGLFESLVSLHTVKRKPQPGDWLAQHKEPGQTFYQYVLIKPIKPDKKRKIIYISLLGDFDETRKKIVDCTAEYMGIYFGVPVKFHKAFSLSVIPDNARRVHPEWEVKQILTGYVLDSVLKPNMPEDALCYIAFTSSDLWPGKGWNFVYGQAYLYQRCGVWSIFRNGDPSKGKDEFRLCLERTIKTGTHETGHMLSMLHCTAYECNMNGSNHRKESDSNPLWLCPVCLRKLCYATKADPAARYKKLSEFCTKNGLKKQAEFFKKSAETIEKTKKIGDIAGSRKGTCPERGHMRKFQRKTQCVP